MSKSAKLVRADFWRQTLSWITVVGLLVALLITSFPDNVAQAAVYDIPNGDVVALKAALSASGGSRVINLAPSGIYTLTAVDNNNNGANGLPVVNTDITLNGRGATIVRATTAPNFRFFYIGNAGSLTLNTTTFANGNTDTSYGGAINNANGLLTLNNSTFYSNTAAAGGGAVANVGTGISVTVSSGTSYTATLSVNNSTFLNNSTGGFGGGAIYNPAAGGNDMGSATLKGGNGTALVNIKGSTFINNTSTTGGGAIFSGAAGGNGTNGGQGIANLTVSNSTFTSNQSAFAGAAIVDVNLNTGTAGTASANLTLINTTVAGNTSSNQAGAVVVGKFSPSSIGTANTTLYNTLLASNTGGNCVTSNASFSPGLNNLEYTGSAGTSTCGAGSTFTTTNPLLGTTPTDNGGPTLTLLPTGPAIDAGDNTTCAANPVTNLDQRGATRPVGAACDIGAVENGGDFVVRNNTDSGDSLTVGSLSFYLKYATGGQTITFILTTGSTIKINGPLPPLARNAKLGSGCNNIILDGSNVSGDGLVLGGNNTVKGITVKSFGGRQIVNAGLNNRLSCTIAVGTK